MALRGKFYDISIHSFFFFFFYSAARKSEKERRKKEKKIEMTYCCLMDLLLG